MSPVRLKTLVIENFRALRGKVVIPLDAQVVLVHGTNGMGKTSVLAALELALTGKVAHLAAHGPSYQQYLPTFGTAGGHIELVTTAPLTPGAAQSGSLDFSNGAFVPQPLLVPDDARHFAERCYLPQATLGKLLELYNQQVPESTSPLTRFVKELLGLEPLDALVDGLYPAFNVARVRNLVPEYRRFEALRAGLKDDLEKLTVSITAAEQMRDSQIAELRDVLAGLYPDRLIQFDDASGLTALQAALATSQEEPLLAEISTRRAHLGRLQQRWKALPAAGPSVDRASRDRAEQVAALALAGWRDGRGRDLENTLSSLRSIFPDLPPSDDGVEACRLFAIRRLKAEEERCRKLLEASAGAETSIKALGQTIERATTRISELNDALALSIADARAVANALAGVSPHINDQLCPVCDRDFSERGAGSLAIHLAAKIAALTSEAGRLQALARERAEETVRLTAAQRELLGVQGKRLPDRDRAELSVRASQMLGYVQRLEGLSEVAQLGDQLIAALTAAGQAATSARHLDEMSASLLPELEQAVIGLTGQPISAYATTDEAFIVAHDVLLTQLHNAQRLLSSRVRAASELSQLVKQQVQIATLQKQREQTMARLESIDSVTKAVDRHRDTAKRISDASGNVRASIAKTVFNTSLNKTWRDLFVRLAPSEQFVPAFKLPDEDGDKVEAILETLHRSGSVSGSPDAMLSQGNLNTAALTLFLALHLSVPAKMPWLILDDPVQSMDDVHIAQFAALLRTLGKRMARQLVVAVHERALFDYLKLELSPAFPGDSLIAVEISRNFEGDAVAVPTSYDHHDDKLVAA